MVRSLVESVIDQLAEELSRSVVINDPAMQMLYASPHYGDEDPVRVRALLHHGAEPRVRGHVLAQGVSTWTRAGIIPANDELELHARVCFPVRWQGELLGLLMIMDADSSITTAELARTEQVAAELAFALHGELADGSDAQALEALVRAVAGDDPAARRAAVTRLRGDGGYARDAFDAVAAVDIGVLGRATTTVPHVEIALRHALETRSRTDVRASLFAVTGRAAVLFVGGAAPDTTAVVAQVQRVLDRAHEFASGHFRCVAGIGGTVTGLDDAARSLGQARLARRAAELRLRGPVAEWDTLDAYGPVLAMRPGLLTPDLLPAPLQRLLRIDADGSLAATLRAYLDAAGNGPDAAARLHVHRTSLYYRLGRIHDLTGLDVSDGATRLACHLGFAMLDVLQATPAD